MKSLNSVEVGERVVVERISDDSEIKKRLLDIGLIPNTEVECVGESPPGDPKAFLIRGAVIAIRSEDAKFVIVKKTP